MDEVNSFLQRKQITTTERYGYKYHHLSVWLSPMTLRQRWKYLGKNFAVILYKEDETYVVRNSMLMEELSYKELFRSLKMISVIADELEEKFIGDDEYWDAMTVEHICIFLHYLKVLGGII